MVGWAVGFTSGAGGGRVGRTRGDGATTLGGGVVLDDSVLVGAAATAVELDGALGARMSPEPGLATTDGSGWCGTRCWERVAASEGESCDCMRSAPKPNVSAATTTMGITHRPRPRVVGISAWLTGIVV